jgi:hypothetical protein
LPKIEDKEKEINNLKSENVDLKQKGATNELVVNNTKTDLQKIIDDKEKEISNLKSENAELKSDNLSQKILLEDVSNGGINGKIIHLNNLFSKRPEFRTSLNIDVDNFKNQFDTKDKRKDYINELYRWSSLVMLNITRSKTTYSVYEEYMDTQKYKPESFINAIFLFTVSFQIGIMDNVLY